MKKLVTKAHWIAGAAGCAVLAAGVFGTGSAVWSQDKNAPPPAETIFARKILMDSIVSNMDEVEAIAALEKIEQSDLMDGKNHAEIVSAMLLAFPHMFPPATNQWKPGGGHDAGRDTFAAPEIWSKFSDFYSRAKASSDIALKASRAETVDDYKRLVAELRVACDSCHGLYMKKD
jgi:cytochrome c556